MSHSTEKPTAVEKDWGFMAQFETPKEILHAAEALREKGYKKFEVYSPFPVHGMDDAMGLKASPLPWIILTMGCIGLGTALALQLGTSTSYVKDFAGFDFGYEMIISGKANGIQSLPAFIPVCFELTVLLAAFGAVFGMFALNGLPTFYRPEFKHDAFKKVTDDKFFIAVSANDSKFGENTKTLLEEIGGHDVTLIQD